MRERKKKDKSRESVLTWKPKRPNKREKKEDKMCLLTRNKQNI
jgi:hypothetical protein